MDQDQLSGLELPPTKSQDEGNQPQQHSCPDLPQGFTPSTRSWHEFGGLFQPLPAESVRLLEITPGSEGLVSCRFFISTLSECAFKYETISSCSSPQTPSEPLCLDGMQIGCNADIVSLLHRLRLPDRSRLLWLPSLCINLDDLNERNYHAQQARAIYQHAHQVIIWLGTATSAEVYAQAASLYKIVNTWRRKRRFEEYFDKAKPPNSQTDSVIHEAGPLTIPEAWSHAVSFFARGWFASVWSLPEASVARSTVVLLGDCQVPWDGIGLAAAVLRENFGRIQSVQNEGKRPIVTAGILNAYLMYRVSTSQQHFDPLTPTFHELLTLTRGFRCKFEHDKVYALLGIARDSGALNIVPDYATPPSQVNRDVAILLLHTSNSLDMLSQVQIDHDCHDKMPGTLTCRGLVLDGPSWVPRWQTNVMERICPLQKGSGFSAATAASPTFQISPDHLKLAACGVIVDTVAETRELRVFNCFWRGQDSRPGGWGGTEQEIFQSLLDAAALTHQDLESLALTLICGKRWDGFPVSDLEAHVADYARCLIRDGLRWSLTWLQGAKDYRAMNSRDGGDKLVDLETLTHLSLKGRADRFLDAARTAGTRRANFTTQQGFWGIGPGAIMEGDMLFVFHGAGVPFMIRPLASGEYHLVGECYVDSIMRGEILDGFEKGTNGQLCESWITLV